MKTDKGISIYMWFTLFGKLLFPLKDFLFIFTIRLQTILYGNDLDSGQRSYFIICESTMLAKVF